jgi:hypothetical protein
MDTIMILKSYEKVMNICTIIVQCTYIFILQGCPISFQNFSYFLELHNYYVESRICHSQLDWMQIKPHRYKYTIKKQTKMGHLYIHWQRKKDYLKTIQKHEHTNILQNHKHDKTSSETKKHQY